MDSQQTPQQQSADPVASNYPSEVTVATNVSTVTPLWKDLLVPASIIIAGIAIGAGLYFNGGGGGSAPVAGGVESGETFQERVTRLADNAGVSEGDLNTCIEDQADEMAARVQSDVDNAIATGGRGTPWSVVIGPTGKTYPLNGALPVQAIQQAIDLARSEGAVPSTDGEVNTDAVNPVTNEDWIKGSRNAVVTVVEYSDYDCPFCGRFHTSMDQVVNANDDVAWVYRHFPLDQLHPNARTVSVAAECVGEIAGNDAFWSFTDAYFAGT